MKNKFLPMTKKELEELSIKQLDFICVTGDAYVDHPSFGIAIIARVVESLGFNVGVIAAPNITGTADFLELGEPKLGFLITSGNIDSMVSNYTVAKKRRSEDIYLPPNAPLRPDNALIVYCNIIKKLFPKTPIIIGGLEASLRRFGHYDYYSDTVKPSILISSKADILTYGMGEHQITDITTALKNGTPVSEITNIRGCCYLSNVAPDNSIILPSFKEITSDKKKYAISCKLQFENQDHISGKELVEPYDDKFLVQTKPSIPLKTNELDTVYSLSFTRQSHPKYDKVGGIKATREVEFSITHNRGCYGGCNFCSLAFHQGRYVTSRSKDSIVSEAKSFLNDPNFKGYISDVGGPTANFRRSSCDKSDTFGMCKDKKCLAPTPCKNLIVDHTEYLDILRTLREIPGIKKVFIRSGIRFDYVMADKNDEFMKELCKYHISGQLKVAPEHSSDHVLAAMGKPSFKVYEAFLDKFTTINRVLNKKQYLVPYLMSSHPSSTLKDAISLAKYIKKTGHSHQQVQDFYPTPGTVSTCIYYTGIDPFTGTKVHIPSQKEKMVQRALLQYDTPQNKRIVKDALHLNSNMDLNSLSKDSARLSHILENSEDDNNHYQKTKPKKTFTYNISKSKKKTFKK
ncbi:MAG: YgiQ family radical SAM protein [Clostridia bacterium]